MIIFEKSKVVHAAVSVPCKTPNCQKSQPCARSTLLMRRLLQHSSQMCKCASRKKDVCALSPPPEVCRAESGSSSSHSCGLCFDLCKAAHLAVKEIQCLFDTYQTLTKALRSLPGHEVWMLRSSPPCWGPNLAQEWQCVPKTRAQLPSRGSPPGNLAGSVRQEAPCKDSASAYGVWAHRGGA